MKYTININQNSKFSNSPYVCKKIRTMTSNGPQLVAVQEGGKCKDQGRPTGTVYECLSGLVCRMEVEGMPGSPYKCFKQ